MKMNAHQIKLKRLRTDFLHYAETLLRITNKADVSQVIRFKLNPVQASLWALEQEQLRTKGRSRIIVLKGRQGGVTTLNQALNFWKAAMNLHIRVMTLVHKGGGPDDPLSTIFGITKRFVEEWPDVYNALMPQFSDARKYRLDFEDLDSLFITGSAGARGVGRGITLTRFHGSEYADWPDFDGALKQIHPSLDRMGTAVQLESTAGTHESPPHVFWKAAANPLHPYTQAFYPWWDTDFGKQLWRELQEPFNGKHRKRWPDSVPDELSPLTSEEIDVIRNGKLEPERILWRRQEILQSGSMQFLQEYAEDPESCWLVGGDLVLGDLDLKTLLDRAMDSQPAVVLREHESGGVLRWHINPKLLKDRCVLGADVAQGTGNDESCFEVRTVSDFQLVCRYSSNKIAEVPDFADLIAKTGKRCPGKAFLVVENNGPGLAVNRRLSRELNYGAVNIYHREIDLARKKDKRSRSLGWQTNEANKHLIIGLVRTTFTEALADELEPPTPEAVRDAFSVVRDKNDPTKFDLNGRDALVAYALTCFGRLKALRAVVAGPPVRW